MELRGKTAIVTGGARRVGRALSLALARSGCNVLIHHGHSTDAARDVCREAAACGVESAVCAADLRQSGAPEAVLAAAADHFGGANILVNSAAIFPPRDELVSADERLWEDVLAVNLKAPFFLTQAFAAALRGGAGGAVLNLLDARVRRPAGDHIVYRLAKGALWQLTESLARSLAPAVRVNGLALGAILPPPDAGPTTLAELAARDVPLRRPGDLETVTASALHLLSQDFLTGTVLVADGGQYL